MAKKLVHNYTFLPAGRQINISYIYKPERLLMIVNATDNITLFQFNSPTLNYTSISYDYTNEVTTIILAYNTASMSSTDDIQIFVEEDSVSFQPDETFIDPVSKIRVSTPENLIDTDFEYGLQSQKWETLEQVKNIPTFFSRSGDVNYQTTAINILINSDIVTVVLAENHNLANGSPVIVIGSKSITCDGGFVATNILSATSFQYKAKAIQSVTGSILDQYTQIFPGSVYQGTEFDLSGIEAITTNAAASSTLTVNTSFPTNFSTGTSFYLTNSISSVSLTFDPNTLVTRGYETSVEATSNSNSFSENNFALKSVQPYYHAGRNAYYFSASTITINTGANVLNTGETVDWTDGYYTYIAGVGNTAISGLTDKTVYYVDGSGPPLIYDDAESGTISGTLWQTATRVTIQANGTGTGTGGFGASGSGSTRHFLFSNDTGFNDQTSELVSQPINMSNYESVSFRNIMGTSSNGGRSLNLFSETLRVSLINSIGQEVILVSNSLNPFNWQTFTYTIPVGYRTAGVRIRFLGVGLDAFSDQFGLDNITFQQGPQTQLSFQNLNGTTVILGSIGTDGGVTNSSLIRTDRCFDTVDGELRFTADDSAISRNVNIPVGTPVAFLNSSAGFGLTSMPNLQTSTIGIYYVASSSTNRISVSTTPGGGSINIPDGQETFVVPLVALTDANSILFPSHGLANNSVGDFQTISGGSAPIVDGTYSIEVINADKLRFKNLTSGQILNLTAAGTTTSVFQITVYQDNIDVDSIYLQSNNLSDGQEVTYNSGGNSIVPGLVNGGNYYVFQKTSDRIKLSETQAGWSSEAKTFLQTYPSNTGINSSIQFYIPSHGFGNGDRVQYLSSNPVAGLVNGAWYYVNAVSADRIRLYREKDSALMSNTDYVRIAGPTTGTGSLRRADLLDMAIDDSTTGITLGSYSIQNLTVTSGAGSLNTTTGAQGVSFVGINVPAAATTTSSTNYLTETLQTLGDDWLVHSTVASGQARFKTVLRDASLVYVIGTHRERTASTYDIAVIAYDHNGTRQWIRTGFVGGFDFTVTGAAFTSANDIIIVGSFVSGTTYPAVINFNISTRTFGNTQYSNTYTPAVITGVAWRIGQSAGYIEMTYNSNQVMYARIQSNFASYFWVALGTSGTTTDTVNGNKIATDSSDNLYLSYQTTTFSFGGGCIQIRKINTSGNDIWTRLIGGVNNDQPYGMALDSNNDVYVSGVTASQGAGGNDIIVFKLSGSTGAILWQRVIGTAAQDIGYAARLRNDQTLAVIGVSDSTLGTGATVYDTFESGTFSGGLWAVTTGVGIRTNGSGTGQGGFSTSGSGSTRHVEFDTGSTRILQTQAINLASATGMSFRYISGNSGNGGEEFDGGENLNVEISLNGSSWFNLTSLGASASWTTVEIAIPAIYRTATTRIRFTQSASGDNFDEHGLDALTFISTVGSSASAALIELDTANGNIKFAYKLEKASPLTFYDAAAGIEDYFIVGSDGNEFILVNLDSLILGGTHSLDTVGIGASDGTYAITNITDLDTFTMASTNQINTRSVAIDGLIEVDLSRNALKSENHYFKTGSQVTYTTSTTALGNLTAGATYYVIAFSKDWFKLATTSANAIDGNAVPITAHTAGTHTFTTASVTGDIVGTGTLSIAADRTVITGDGTLFAAQFSPGDVIKLYQPASTATKNISSVNAGTDTITVANHDMVDGDPIYFTQDVYNLTANWIYYINTSGTAVPADEFTVHASRTAALAGISALNLDGASYSAADIIEHIDSIGTATDAVIQYVNGQTEIVLRDAVTEAFTSANYAIGTSLLVRADGFALHRPYDGGVELIPSRNPDGQMVRQTRKYFRYQSGKGIQVSMAINFSPTVQPESMTRPSSGTTTRATITTRYPHRLTVGRNVTITGATITSGTNWWNGTFAVSTVINDFAFTVLMSGTPSQLSAGGLIDYYVNSWTNSRVKAGLFDDQNGLYFEYDGQNLYAVRRSSVLQISGSSSVTFKSGSVVGNRTKFSTQLSVNDKIVIKGQTYLITNIANDTQMYIMPTYRGTDNTGVIITKIVDTKIPQSSWNLDSCNGTGRSGYFLDIHKIQMAYIDYSWYGAGKARFGFKDQRGKVVYCHEFIHNNKLSEAYMRSGNLPARYEIENVGTPTYVPSLAHWGTSVIMDGRFDDDRAYVFTASSNNVSISGAATITITGRIETTAPYEINVAGVGFRTAGFGILIPTSSATFNNITTGIAVSGANLSANTLTSLPSSTVIAPRQPYQASVFSRFGGSSGTQATRNILLVNRIPTNTAGGTSSYTVTLSSGATPVVYEQPLISIRLAPSVDTGTPGALGSREIINRMQLILDSVGILTTHSVEITLRLNGTTNNNDWQRVANPSLSQLVYHSTDDRITNGAVIYSFRAQGSTGTSNRAQTLTTANLGEVATLGNSILGGDGVFPDGPDVLTVVAKLVEDPSTVSAANPFNISGRISWAESQA